MKTLRARLTLTHTMVALLAVVLVALLASPLIRRAYDELSRQRTDVARRTLERGLAEYYERNRGWGDVADELESRLEGTSLGTRRVVLADTRHRVIYDSAGLLEGRPLPLRMRPQAVPIRARGQERPVGRLVLPLAAQDLDENEAAFLRSITWIVIAGSVASGSVALVVALLLSNHVTAPLRRLTTAARRLAAGERYEALPTPADAELAELARAFNKMAADLNHQEELRNQMMADVAHELRTPLSVLRLQIEGLEDGVEQPTPATFASLRHEVTLLSHLIDDLRLVSLATAGQLPLSPAALDPHQLLADLVSSAAARARQQGIDLRTESNGQVPPVQADPQRLAQVLGNLLENALRYTPHGGSVTLRAAAAPHQRVLFEVADTGPGIAPTELPRIFERFYRTTRARDRESGGSGLGLSIVKHLVEAQQGEVTVQSTPGQGTTFQVWLPVAGGDPRL